MATLAAGRAHVVDLSSPPAVSAPLRLVLEDRYHSIDQLPRRPAGPGDALVRRLRAWPRPPWTSTWTGRRATVTGTRPAR